MDQNKNGDKETFLTFKTLFENFRDSRKIFRLFKSVNEAQSLHKVFFKSQGDMDDTEAMLFAAARLGFLLYWVFDNLSILSKLKVLKSDAKTFFKPSMFFWWVGILFTIINTFRKIKNFKAQAKKLIEATKADPEKKAENDKALAAIKNKIFACQKTLIKMFGDSIPSGAGWGLFEKLGIQVGDTAIGLGGLISALISVEEVYSAAK